LNEQPNDRLFQLGSGTRNLTKRDLMAYDTVMGKKMLGGTKGGTCDGYYYIIYIFQLIII